MPPGSQAMGPMGPSVGPTAFDPVSYVVSWRNQLSTARRDKEHIWSECWQLYRGVEDFSDKLEWQSKIVIPKAFSSVKQAVNVIKRLLMAAKQPWALEAVNPDDLVSQLRAAQMTDLTRWALEDASFFEEFSEGLECGFITGLGVWKVWWGMRPRTITSTEVGPHPSTGELSQLLVRREVMEGHLFVKAVDPYNFHWLPGSKLNRWVGTIEDIEIPRWELLEMAEAGAFGPDGAERVWAIQPLKSDQSRKQPLLRFSERPKSDASSQMVKLTEFYGPVVQDGRTIRRHGHLIIANDSTVLLDGENSLFAKKPPYVGFSPLALPFRTDGVGLIEMVRQIDKALSKLANLSVDTLVFRLLPVFEVAPDAYENPEDLETGMVPGKVFRRNPQYLGQPGIVPIEFQDISQGAVAVQAALDRSHQEGSLVSEIQQALPRYRGVQTATETEAKSASQDSFFGSMAIDIEKQAIAPIVELASDLIMQFLPTANDPRVASILGVGAQVLAGLSREEIIELVSGDYKVKVSGLSSQLAKAEALESLVQFMNLIGQNPEAWLPYINQDALLHRILESFQPAIRDIDQIVADPETAEARRAAMGQQALQSEALRMVPQLAQMALNERQVAQQAQVEQQRLAAEQAMATEAADRELAMRGAEAMMAKQQPPAMGGTR
jgi:hypothetical protein